MSAKVCFKCKEYIPIRFPGMPDIREEYFLIDHSGHPIASSDTSELAESLKDTTKKYSWLLNP
jgi:hypothetical protein